MKFLLILTNFIANIMWLIAKAIKPLIERKGMVRNIDLRGHLKN